LTAVILTLDEAAHIIPCLESLAWADRLVVLDSFSRDGTAELARQWGSEVLTHPFDNYAQQRNYALSAVSTDWVLFVDADERATPELAAEVRSAMKGPIRAWEVPRHNYIFGRLTLGGGWYPDYQLRLVRRGFAQYERPVHEIGVVDGPVGRLSQPLIHLNYQDVAHFRRKQRAYVKVDAYALYQRGVRPRPYTPLLQPMRQFWWRFVSLRGYRDGLHGLRLSLFMAYYEWRKVRELQRLWDGGDHAEPAAASTHQR
jgi:glycosyltransferase involved in cell wall biosynthesis